MNNIYKINYKVFQDHEWADLASVNIFNKISKFGKKRRINLIITGGKTAKEVYRILKYFLINTKTKINFYFSDERCVDPANNKSNYLMIKKNLLNFENKNLVLHRIFGEEQNSQKECQRYNKKLPRKIDLLILSLGKDGHIASIFPNHKINVRKKIVKVKKKGKIDRYTLTPFFIKKIKNIIILVKGAQKGLALKKTLLNKKTELFPARDVLSAEWFLDKSAFKKISHFIKQPKE